MIEQVAIYAACSIFFYAILEVRYVLRTEGFFPYGNYHPQPLIRR